MTDPAAPAAPQGASAEPAPKSRANRWLSILAGIIAMLFGGWKLVETFTLPACDSSRALDAVRGIFKDKKVPEPTLANARSVDGASGEKTCQADYDLPSEKGVLSYRVFWDGWSGKVMITKAEPRS
jgi:hypothetical protein